MQLYINDEFFEGEVADRPAFLSAPTSLNIIYEDENIILCDKKCGLVVHEDESGSTDTLINRIQHYLYEKGEYRPEEELSFAPALCNRIDPEYSILAQNFNKMAEELAGTETLRGDFISNVSHEFKTPLASIQGFAKLLQSDDITEQEREEYTQIIIDETSRLSKLSSNILRLTKLENQKTVGKKTRFSLDEQIRKILLVLEPEWSKKKIDLDIDLEDIMYVGSEELMAQIWQNIINNAIKFTPEGGKISVKLFRNEKNISAEIWDNGPSIAPDVKAKIFDKFYQGDRSRATEGNGLGLALVKRIIELSEGSIEVENDMKKGGVCFRISLPYLIEDMM